MNSSNNLSDNHDLHPEFIYLSEKYGQLDDEWYLISRTRFTAKSGKELSKVEFSLENGKKKTMFFEVGE